MDLCLSIKLTLVAGGFEIRILLVHTDSGRNRAHACQLKSTVDVEMEICYIYAYLATRISLWMLSPWHSLMFLMLILILVRMSSILLVN